jgi:glutamate-ammonia-ligase adenylyltransferase
MPASWPNAIKASADASRVKHFFHLLSAIPDIPVSKMPSDQARILASVFAGSEALSNSLLAHIDWLKLLDPEALKFPRRKQGLAAEIQDSVGSLLQSRDYESGLKLIREFKQREMLRIGARDLARLANSIEITRELSDVADVCLQTVWSICFARLSDKLGAPFHPDIEGEWHATKSCVLGMGKLGGQELNYSSDVDVLFVYSDEGVVSRHTPSVRRPTAGGITNHQFYCRLAEAFIAEVSKMAPEGMLYRIDLRLRPEGDLGPLARSLASYETYYAQWGQTWERMMMIKARGVSGDAALAAEFLEMIQPFRYPRSINPDVLHEVAAMKDRIENEVVKEGELDRNVKLGRGGIREIEFVAQSQQLLHAGRQPFLQGAQTLPCLEKLAQYELLDHQDAAALREAYCFLRDLEHRLQMESNLQTHTIPTDKKSQERLARLMDFSSLKKFGATHLAHRMSVRRIFEKVLHGKGTRELEAPLPFPEHFEGAEAEWKRLLAEHRFREPEKAFRVIREFVEGPGYVHVSPRTQELARKLLPRLLVRSPTSSAKSTSEVKKSKVQSQHRSRGPVVQLLSDPDRVVTRLDSFIAAYGARSTLFELWNSNPGIFDLLVLLFDRSEFLAELSIRTPDLVDELVTSGRLRQRKTGAETLEDLRHGINDADQHAWMRKYHQAELMRIGLRDILGLADEDQYLVELSALADACLQYALEVVMRKNRLKKPPFAIIGLGKLGGAEIDYGSDLDILFISTSSSRDNEASFKKGSSQHVSSAPLARLAKMAAEVMDLLSKRTEHGIVFHSDARLRPDGEKGLLVNTLDAYRQYYRQRAALWEIQTLTRTRAVAGDLQAGAAFQELATALTNFQNFDLKRGKPRSGVHAPAAYTPAWKQEIDRMRMRIEKERTSAGKDDLAIKTGKGGLVDAEFVAQAVCLENGWHEPNTLRALQKTAGQQGEPISNLINAYRKLRRLEGILRRWSYEGETVLPDDPAPYYRVAVRSGFATAEEFRKALAQWRTDIREGYRLFFGKPRPNIS